LRALVGWLEPRLNPDTATPAPAAQTSAPAAGEAEPEVEIEPSSLREVIVEPLGPTVPNGVLRGTTAVVVAGDLRLTTALGEALTEHGSQVTLLTPQELSDETGAAGVLAEADVLVDLSATIDGHDARAVFDHLRPALLGRATRVLA